ncbi:hypothetical protein C808_00845 [Lachnospiraceae bacterium M18-1]|nr:hypothetical protein C808_00845 [Lachnospiraceae bacterium M18-1]
MSSVRGGAGGSLKKRNCNLNKLRKEKDDYGI